MRLLRERPGCPRHRLTTRAVDAHGLDWATQRLTNLHNAWRGQMTDVLARLE